MFVFHCNFLSKKVISPFSIPFSCISKLNLQKKPYKACIKREYSFVYTATMLGYIDPGLGGLIVQSLIAGCLTVVYFFRNAIAKVFAPFKKLFKK